MDHSQPLRLLHLSDLHFGRIEDRVLKKLEDFIGREENRFHLAILTGDLTQRAKSAQFIAAKEFLAKLKCPLFIVPGNHDVPLYNPFIRFFNPYLKFKRYFSAHSPQFYEDDNIIVYGLWTVNSFSIKDATIDLKQVAAMEQKFSSVGNRKIKLIAFHHPLRTSESSRVEKALVRIRSMKPHLMMWGHDHKANAEYFDEKTQTGPVMVAAGTSVSNRTREETNSFNVIEVSASKIAVQVVAFENETNDFKNTKKFDFDVGQILKD